MPAKPKHGPDDLITTIQAAELLGVSRCRVQQLVKAGRLPAQKIGRDLFIRFADLDAVRERKSGWVKGRKRG